MQSPRSIPASDAEAPSDPRPRVAQPGPQQDLQQDLQVGRLLAPWLTLAFLGLAVFLLAGAESRARARADEAIDALQRLDARSLRLEETLAARAGPEAVAEAGSDPATTAASAALEHARRAHFRAELELARDALERGLDQRARRALERAPEAERSWVWHRLERQLQGSLTDLTWNAADEPTALALDPAGTRLVVGTQTGLVATLRPRGAEAPEAPGAAQPIPGFDEPVTALALLPNDATGAPDLAVGGRLGALAWLPGGHLEGARLFELDQRVTALAALRTAQGAPLVIAADVEGHVHLWRPERGELRSLTQHDDTVEALAACRDAKGTLWVASGSDDRTLRLVALSEDGTPAGAALRLEGHEDWVRAVAFDAGGSTLASVSDDGRLLTWAVGSSAPEPRTVATHDQALIAVAFGPDARPFALGEDGALVDETGTRSLPLSAAGGDFVVASALGHAPGEPQPFVALLDADERVLWRPPLAREGPRFEGRIEGTVRALAVLPGGRALAAGSSRGPLRLWTDPFADAPVVHDLAGHERMTRALAFDAEGARLASGDALGRVYVWDVATGERLHAFDLEERVEALAFPADAAQLLAVPASGAARLFDLADGRELRRAPAAPGFVFRGLASADGRRYGWVGDAGTLRLWDALDGERVAAARVRAAGLIEAAATSRQGERVAFTSNTTGALVVDAEGTVRARVSDRVHGFRCLTLSADGRRLATGSGDGRLRVHDSEGGALLFELPSVGRPLLALAFDPTGSVLAAGDGGGRVWLW